MAHQVLFHLRVSHFIHFGVEVFNFPSVPDPIMEMLPCEMLHMVCKKSELSRQGHGTTALVT